MSRGLLVIISSPSGGGKDTVIRSLLKVFANSTKLVTTTSRNPRKEDQDGITYHFVSKENFEEKIEQNKLVEHNFYSGNYYGVERSELENKLANFELVFSQIDINGKKSLSKAGFENLSIFLVPSSLEDLKGRINRRGGVNESDLHSRLETAKKEIEMAKEYDHKIINENGKLAETIEKVANIIREYQARHSQ